MGITITDELIEKLAFSYVSALATKRTLSHEQFAIEYLASVAYYKDVLYDEDRLNDIVAGKLETLSDQNKQQKSRIVTFNESIF